MDGRTRVSIIVPAFNAEAHLDDTIKQVREQTMGEWELILVDNGSSDGTGRIIDEAAADDPRIRAVHVAVNEGPGPGRNAGLPLAQGDYLWFLDADDEFDADLLERSLDAAAEVEGGADLVMFGYAERYFDDHGRHLYDHELPLDRAVYPHPEDWHSLVAGWERSTHLGYLWNKLIRRELVSESGLAFEAVRLNEDFFFMMDLLPSVSSVAVMGGCPYRYAKRKGAGATNANAYSARDYWALHKRRSQELCDLLDGWSALTPETLEVVGSLYARYVISAVERSFSNPDRMEAGERLAWCQQILELPLSQRLIPHARSESSRVLQRSIGILQTGDARRVVRLCHLVHIAHDRAYGLFTKLRSGR